MKLQPLIMTNKMILNRIQPYIEPILRPNKNGFRSHNEGVKSHNLNAIIIFVDFKKAFKSINRATMLQIIEAYGIPTITIQTIALTYKDKFAKVTSPDGDTALFEIKREFCKVTH